MTANKFFSDMLASSLLLVIGTAVLVFASGEAHRQIEPVGSSAAQQFAIDVKGTWSGTFFSKHSSVPPFTMTVVISPDSGGHLVGNSTLNSHCLKDAHFEVTVNSSSVVLAGSSNAGVSITVRGTIDSTGTLLNAKYILNGSATGECETDDGTGNLAKR